MYTYFTGLKPCDIAKTEQMKQLLCVRPVRTQYKLPQRFEGLLIKVNTSVSLKTCNSQIWSELRSVYGYTFTEVKTDLN